jgi:hypothetical protein
MKKLLVYFLIILFPVTGFSQVNINAAKIKRKGIKEERLFDPGGSVPSAIVSYDREGRVIKTIVVDFYVDSPMSWTVVTMEYDTLGRISKRRTNYSRDKDIGKMNFVLWNDETETHIYIGDSVTIKIDSIWRDARLVDIYKVKQTEHWKKMPPPHPRPIFWQDSICTSIITFHTFEHYHYANPTDRIPAKISTGDSLVNVSWSIENGKLIERQKMEAHRENGGSRDFELETYTLNHKHDTMQLIYIVQIYSLKGNEEIIYDSTHLTLTTTCETTRIGRWYKVHYVRTEERLGHKNLPPVLMKKTQRKPWNDESITCYYINRLYETTGWEFYWVIDYYGKGKKETIYWK